MKREVNFILRYHKKGIITTEEAENKILALLGVSNRLSRSEQNDEDYYDRIRSGQN